jgi:hypothetical protein
LEPGEISPVNAYEANNPASDTRYELAQTLKVLGVILVGSQKPCLAQ